MIDNQNRRQGPPAWIAFLLRPFPRAEGFSAYRSPGLLVHVPVMLLFVLLGVLVWRDQAGIPILAIFFLVGLYVGRDIAVLSHYNPLLTLVVWAASAVALLAPNMLVGWSRALKGAAPWAPWGVTACVVVLFGADMWFWCKKGEQ